MSKIIKTSVLIRTEISFASTGDESLDGKVLDNIVRNLLILPPQTVNVKDKAKMVEPTVTIISITTDTP